MRKITMWLLSTVAVIVLLFTYRTSTNGGGAQASPIVASTPAAGATTSASNPAAGTTSASPSAKTTSGTSSGTKTYTGATASTRWGDVQVSITVTNGKITDVQVPVYPNGNGRDQEINAYALPALTQETLAAQSAKIDTVSGATVTSDGYLQSLQSALDAANLG